MTAAWEENRFRRLLARERVVVLDGGLATELEAKGYDLADPLWSTQVVLEAPDAIVAVHRDYLAAGAAVIATTTYQATFEGLAARGLSRVEAASVMCRAVELAEEARAAEGHEDAAIAGSVGSYGAFLADGSEYTGAYGDPVGGLAVAELATFHRPRLALLAPRVDVLACETIPCLAEARALAVCLRELDAPAWVSFQCRSQSEVASGEPLSACVEALNRVPQVAAIGVNCVSPRWAGELVARLATLTDKAVMVYPNSGEQYRGTWCGDATEPADFAELARSWVVAGARIVGGCCRTGPEHIRRVAEACGDA